MADSSPTAALDVAALDIIGSMRFDCGQQSPKIMRYDTVLSSGPTHSTDLNPHNHWAPLPDPQYKRTKTSSSVQQASRRRSYLEQRELPC